MEITLLDGATCCTIFMYLVHVIAAVYSLNYLKSIYFLRFSLLFFLGRGALRRSISVISRSRLRISLVGLSSIVGRLLHLVNLVIIVRLYRVQFLG